MQLRHLIGHRFLGLLCLVLSVWSPAYGFLGEEPKAGSIVTEPLTRFHKSHPAMGTEFSIDIYANNQGEADRAINAAFDEIDRLEDLLSNYRPTSELSRISREASNEPVTTDPETFRFLQRAFFWSERSDGAFDITVGPLLRAWGFFFHGGRIPSESELSSLRSRVGWQNVTLDSQKRTVSFSQHQSMELDPGSIGKGFAIDQVVTVLRELGVTSAFLSAGGSTLYAIGAPPGTTGWPVNIPDPLHPGRIASKILLKDSSLSTGACTVKFFIKDGHRYCHIFDPKSLRPVEGVLQTSVIVPSATDSDALSTVVFVLDPAASRRLIASTPESKALVFRQPQTKQSCFDMNWPGDPCGQTQQMLQRGDRR